MIAQMIIPVGGGNVEYNPGEESFEIMGDMISFTVGGDEFRQLQIAGVFGVNMAKHCHGRGKKTSIAAVSVKPLHQKSMIAVTDLHEAGVGYRDTTTLCQILKQLLPEGNIIIIICGWEFGNPEAAIFINCAKSR